MSIYEQLSDKDIIRRVNDIFYDKVYAHPWISQYFQAVSKEFISSQQTDFIIGALGGPKKYSGRLPSNAHTHMLISEELFDLRSTLLKESLKECKAPELLVDRWLAIDEAFRKVIVKKSFSECEKRWPTDEIIDIPNPHRKTS